VVPEYIEFRDTLELEPGEHRTLDVLLERVDGCQAP